MDIGLTIGPLASGFALGAACIFSIGPQNLQLIERGAMRDYPITAASVGYACEIPLVAFGVAGIGSFVAQLDILNLIHCAAAAFQAVCGMRTLLRASGPSRPGRFTSATDRRSVIVAMLTVTLLNPLVYLEIVTIGGIFSSAYGSAAGWFGVGFLAASAIRFFGLSAFGWALAPWLREPSARRALSGLAGGLLLVVAASQALTAF